MSSSGRTIGVGQLNTQNTRNIVGIYHCGHASSGVIKLNLVASRACCDRVTVIKASSTIENQRIVTTTCSNNVIPCRGHLKVDREVVSQATGGESVYPVCSSSEFRHTSSCRKGGQCISTRVSTNQVLDIRNKGKVSIHSGRVKVDGISTVAEVDCVNRRKGCTHSQRVVTRTARDVDSTCAGSNRVITRTTGNSVVTCRHVNNVIPGATGDVVITSSSRHGVSTRATSNSHTSSVGATKIEVTSRRAC